MSDSYIQAAEGGDEDEIHLLDLLHTVVDNLRLLVLGPLVVGLLALGGSFLVPPTFTAQTSFLPPQQQQSMAASMLSSLGALGGLAGAAAGLKNPADQYVAFLKSNAVQDVLIDQFKLMERYEVEHRENARRTLESNVKIASGKDGIIVLSVDDREPAFAAELANAHVQALTGLMSRLALTEAQQRRQFFEKQLQSIKLKLADAQAAMGQSGVSASVLNAQPQSAVALVAALQAQVTAKEVQLSAMRGYLTESAPEFKQAMGELVSLRTQLAKQSSDKSQASNAAGNDDYINRYREFKYQETLFELMARQYEVAKVDESREGASIQVIDVAQAPELKAKPKKALIAVLATLATGFALLLFVFVRQAARNASSDPESAAKWAAIGQAWRRALGRA